MRARNIKPGFFTNEDLSELPFSTRMFFIGLWCYADRDGFLEVRPKKIRAAIFPYDFEFDIHRELATLVQSAFTLIYYPEDDQQLTGMNPILQIVNFNKHQRPHVNEKPSEYKDIIKHYNQGAKYLLPKRQPLRSDCLNEDCLNEDSLNEDTLGSCLNLSDLWNTMVASALPSVLKITTARKIKINKRLKETPKDHIPETYWPIVIQKILDSDFCCGTGKEGWKANFDWLLQPDTHIKVMEGKYTNSNGKQKTKHEANMEIGQRMLEQERIENGESRNSNKINDNAVCSLPGKEDK